MSGGCELISLNEVQRLKPEEYVYVDIRGEIAYSHGHIPGAICWGEGNEPDSLPKDKKLILYCGIGENSVPAAQNLRQLGYEAYSLKQGYRAWLKQCCEDLSSEELKRYDRQMILPQVGVEGQKKLKNAKVLIVGAGGLGAPAALYLAGAGVGTIGIMDADGVNISNLHRQIIHSTERLDMNKADSARVAIRQLNELVHVDTYPYFLAAENAEEIISRYDFVIDAADNFETKFLINDTCVLLGKPFCHGGILQFQGQVMTYVLGEYPCYRCVFEEVPESGSIPNCSQAGVIGAMGGIIGSVQALEAAKYILGTGGLLTGKLFVFDGLTMRTRIVDFKRRNPDCRVCGDNRQIQSIKDCAEEYEREACDIAYKTPRKVL